MQPDRYLIDTCCLSTLVDKKLPHPGGFLQWLEAHQEVCFISVVTLHELRLGEQKLRGRKREEDRIRGRKIAEANARIVQEYFSGRILQADQNTFTRAADIRAAAEREVGDIGMGDSLLAETATAHDLQIVTRNVRHFLAAGVRAIDVESLTTPSEPQLRIIK